MQKMEVEQISHNYNTIDVTNNTNNEATEIKFAQSVQQSLKNTIMKEGYTSYKIFKRMMSTNGSNYLGYIYEVDVIGETKEGRKEINIFLKHIIPGEAMKTILDIYTCYSNEGFFYTELKNVFNTLQETVDMPEKERFKMVKSYNGCNNNMILLDNLTKKGFKTLYRMDVMDLKFAELSITQLAKLHGLSFVLEYKNKEYFNKKIKTFKSPILFNDLWKTFVKRIFNHSIMYFDVDTQKKINIFLYTLYEKFPKYFRGDTKSVKCLCHGDFRISNIMINESDEDNTEVVLIDYQFTYYMSPIVDLLYFIYTGTDRQFRNTHLNNLKNLYHNKLTEFLEYFDLNINNVYPKEVFENDFEDCLDFGLMVALYISPIIFATEEIDPDSGKDIVEVMTSKMDDRFKERVTEVVEDYLDWGILK